MLDGGPQLLDSLPVGLCAVDAEGRVTGANRQWSGFSGRTALEIEGAPLSAALPADAAEAVCRLLDSVRASGRPGRAATLTSADSTWDLDAIPRDAGVLLVATNVTERVRDLVDAAWLARSAAERLTVAALEAQDAREREIAARERAERRETQLNALFTSMTEPVLAFDRSGRVEQINRAAAELFGPETVGLDCANFVGRFEMHLPGGRPLPLSDLPASRALRGEVVVQQRLKLRHRGQEMTVLTSASPIASGDEISGAVVIVTNVTELDRAEAALRESEDRFRAFVETIPHLAFIADPEGHVTYRNGRFLDYFGFLEGPATAMVAAEDAPSVSERWKNGIRSRAPFVLEARLRRRDGQHRWNIARVSPVLTDDGTIRMWVGTSTDVHDQREAATSLQRANEQLREADHRKNEFLAVLSHELRNPLTPIRNSVYIMERAAPGGEQARRALLVIDRQVAHMARLIDDLLDVTRISKGKIRLLKDVVGLNEVTRGVGEDLRELFRRNGVEFQLEVTEHPLRICADRTRIAQVIGNILQNAAKFTPRGGRVQLSVVREGEQARIEVRDDGPGIDPRILPQLFEPFVQADKTLDRSRGGLGLGLALARGIVELHGGTITASSEGAGKGSSFTVRLPLHDEQEYERSRSAVAPPPARRLRVLIVEDNEDSATSLKEVLELQGYEVDVALNGREGVETARTTRPDVVLCDIGLPELDGYGVARELRADPRLRSTYLVALSGYALPEDLDRSREAGFDRHVVKPPDRATLDQVLGEAGA